MKISDDSRINSATCRGNLIPVYDDGYGAVYIHRDSMGISGIVRAQSWEDAYSICEDEFLPEANETIEEMEKEYGENFSEDSCWNEGYGFRPNGQRYGKWDNGEPKDPIGHGIYSKDLNGDSLEVLTEELAAALEIKLEITPW